MAIDMSNASPELRRVVDASIANEPDNVREVLAASKRNAPSSQPDLKPFAPAVAIAVEHQSIQVLSLLLSEGLPVSGLAVLQAIFWRSIPAFETFVSCGWNINQPLERTKPPPLAYVLDDMDVVRWFLSHDADPNAPCTLDITPMSVAAFRAPLPTIQFLLERGGRVDRGQLLHHAVLRESEDVIEVLEYLLEQGAPVNALKYQDQPQSFRERRYFGLGTPLHKAAELGMVDVMNLLLSWGANPTILDSKGRTALDDARDGGHMRVLDILAARGFNASRL